MAEFKNDDDASGSKKDEAPKFAWLPEGNEALADGEYDAIIMGTGLTECILGGLLSVKGKRVLQMDRNNYYGSDTASLSLPTLFEKFGRSIDESVFGTNYRDWNVDLVPKYIMAMGNLVKILLHAKVTHYLDFRPIDGSFVYKDGKPQKVPTTGGDVLTSGLIGFFEKRTFYNFLSFLQTYDKDQPDTWKKGKNLDNWTMRELYDHFGLAEFTRTFCGHAMGLQLDDSYLDRPAEETAEKIKLYVYSTLRYGKSPYIYPMYGLGGMPEAFSRLCALHGGTFMLNKDVDEVLTGADGKAWGIRAGSEVAKAPMIIGDSTYFPKDKCKMVGRTVRSICLLNHGVASTDNVDSTQIIIPASQLGRKYDMYVCVVNNMHMVAQKGMWIAIVSTTVENEAEPLKDLEPGIKLLGHITERFDSVCPLYEPLSDGKEDNCFISKSYDATSHFETVADDVLRLYELITGEPLDMVNVPEEA
jgi:Rab GDP dissociation inhibitor